MYLISYGCTFIDGPASFRTAWGIQAIPALILIPALLFFPESPRWLASKDRWEEALDVLALLHGNGDPTHPVVVAEYEEVRDAQAIVAQASQLSWFGLFGPTMWRRTMAAVFAQLWQQLLGGNVMMYYIVYVFQMAGLTYVPFSLSIYCPSTPPMSYHPIFLNLSSYISYTTEKLTHIDIMQWKYQSGFFFGTVRNFLGHYRSRTRLYRQMGPPSSIHLRGYCHGCTEFLRRGFDGNERACSVGRRWKQKYSMAGQGELCHRHHRL